MLAIQMKGERMWYTRAKSVRRDEHKTGQNFKVRTRMNPRGEGAVYVVSFWVGGRGGEKERKVTYSSPTPLSSVHTGKKLLCEVRPLFHHYIHVSPSPSVSPSSLSLYLSLMPDNSDEQVPRKTRGGEGVAGSVRLL